MIEGKKEARSVQQQRQALTSKIRYLRGQLENMRYSEYRYSPAYASVSSSSHIHLERFEADLQW